MKTTIKTASSVAFIVAAAVILGWAATASTVHAADAPQPWLNKTVTYGDLNLETQKGARILFARLQLAAKDACARIEGSTDPAVANENAAGSFVGGVSLDCVGAVPSISAARLIRDENGRGLKQETD